MDTNESSNHRYGGHVSGCVDVTSMERAFIKQYKQLTHLWNPNHSDYNNRYRRNAAYDALLPIFRQHMPKATRFHIRQKINILRSVYRKELRKHLASRTMDSDGNVTYSYKPASWKFHALRFLDCEDEGETDMECTEIEAYPEYEEEQELEYNIPDPNESGNEEPDTSKIHISPLHVQDIKPISRKRAWNMSNSFKNKDNILEREVNAIAANVACKLQRMKAQQRYHAELLIHKVLIKGLKERLTEETDLTESWHVEEVSVNYSTSKGDSNDEAIDKQSDS